jgi:hypothetical protein
MDTIEQICRAICEAEGVDPDRIGYGIGVIMPEGSKYPLWEARIRIAEKLMYQFAINKKSPT